jgi:hypothetical protein
MDKTKELKQEIKKLKKTIFVLNEELFQLRLNRKNKNKKNIIFVDDSDSDSDSDSE